MSTLQGLNKFKYFTDKSLGNFAYIDLIISIFPNAKNLFIVQETLRENISPGIFKQQFDNLPWSHTIGDIMEYVDQYLQVMKIMNKCYSNNILEINHSDLIKNKEKETKKLFRFLNIDWNNKILIFLKNKHLLIPFPF